MDTVPNAHAELDELIEQYATRICDLLADRHIPARLYDQGLGALVRELADKAYLAGQARADGQWMRAAGIAERDPERRQDGGGQ